MLGLPEEELGQVYKWSMATVATFEPVLSAEERSRTIEMGLEFADYLDRLADKRRREPDDGLLSSLIAVEEEGDRLRGEELVGMINLLMAAGNLTTTALLGNGLRRLADEPSLVRALRADPSKINTAVEEMLRLDPSFHINPRKTTRVVEIGGKQIPAGSGVLTLLAAANRDPRRFHDPDRLNIDRGDGTHLTFGSGIHHCLGATLARLEGRIVFELILKRYSSITRGNTAAESLPYLITPAYRNLPVIFSHRPESSNDGLRR
jgi:hypothetical protein